MNQEMNLVKLLDLSLNLTGVNGHVNIHSTIKSLNNEFNVESAEALKTMLDNIYSTGTRGRSITLTEMKELVNEMLAPAEAFVEPAFVEPAVIEDAEKDVIILEDVDEQPIDPIVIHTQLPLEDEPVVEPVVELVDSATKK